jgi:murein DD-endopeptidase MepM/ murein hydrolase activator NlpD
LGRIVLICLVLAGLAAGCAGVATHQRVGATPRAAAENGQPQVIVGVDHVVKPGQTLWRIANAYRVELGELADVNGIDNPARLETGQVLFIPGAVVSLDVPAYPAPVDPGGTVAAAPGEAEAGSEWLWPLRDGEILSGYGAPRRTHRHQGIDIRGRAGQPVLASRAGRVTHSGSNLRGYGKTIILDHGDGLTTLYAHNSNLLVREGQRVDQGQAIARVGSSGNATANHCHFEIRRADRPVDPMTHLRPTREARR